MVITNNIWWIVIVVALGLPGTIVGILTKRIERKLDNRADARVHHEVMLIEMTMASLSLAEATAEAVQRIPDAHCNGDMHEALNNAKQVTAKYREFEREQTVKSIK